MADPSVPEKVGALTAAAEELAVAAREGRDVLAEMHAAIKDLHRATLEAKQEVKSIARNELRRLLAKEYETIAAELRRKIKTED